MKLIKKSQSKKSANHTKAKQKKCNAPACIAPLYLCKDYKIILILQGGMMNDDTGGRTPLMS